MTERPKLFIHCALIENKYIPIMDEFFEAIQKSGMSADVDVNVCTVGNSECFERWYDSSRGCLEISTGEFHTLGLLKEFANKASTKTPIGYIQTKGIVNGFANLCIIDWRKYMTYFVVERMRECINSVMNGYDAAGVDWVLAPNKHFSGTFWWSNSDYIKSLPQINPPAFTIDRCPSPRHLAEFWIGANQPNIMCFHQSGIDVYQRHLCRYEPINYRIPND